MAISTRALGAQLKTVEGFFSGHNGTHLCYLTATDDLVWMRDVILQERHEGAVLTAEHLPAEFAAIVSLNYPDVIVDVIVTHLYDDEDYSWWQRLGLYAAEIEGMWTP